MSKRWWFMIFLWVVLFAATLIFIADVDALAQSVPDGFQFRITQPACYPEPDRVWLLDESPLIEGGVLMFADPASGLPMWIGGSYRVEIVNEKAKAI